MADATARGRFVWHELMTTDTKSAGSFFTKVIGWKSQPWEQDASYTMFIGNGRPMAGLMMLPADARAMGAPPSWLTYIGTPDVDETAQQAKTLGGKVLKTPADIPTIGRWALIQDPQGAVFAAFTPTQGSAPPDAAPTIGDFSWHELATTDQQAAFAFYRQLFGWKETSSMDMGPGMGTYLMFGWKDTPAGGMFTKPSQMPGPPAWLPYISVGDAKKIAETIKQRGGRVINGPMEVPGGDWIAQGTDLQGGMFAVHSQKPAATTPAAASQPAKKASQPAKKARPAKRAAAKSKTAAKSRAARASKPRKAKAKRAGRAKAAGRRSAKKRSAAKKRRR